MNIVQIIMMGQTFIWNSKTKSCGRVWLYEPICAGLSVLIWLRFVVFYGTYLSEELNDGRIT
jgi:hypothetical protein